MSFLVESINRLLKTTKKQKRTVIILGAAKAGKTTLLQFLETGMPVTDTLGPTLGVDRRHKPFNVDGWEFTLIDIGGQELYVINFWERKILQADAVIYVIDGILRETDNMDLYKQSVANFQFAMEILQKNNQPVVIIINKIDLKENSPMKPEEVMQRYRISETLGDSQIPFNLVSCSAKYGDNVNTAVNWLVQSMEQKILNK